MPKTIAKKQVWLLYGTTGEYDDRQEWVVAAFTTQAKANEHKKLAQDRANEIHQKQLKHRFDPAKFDKVSKKNKWDPQMQMDPKAEYCVGEVDLL
jgi:hypothetical protein